MKIVGARWTSSVNILTIRCDCGSVIHHRADLWRVTCLKCGLTAHLTGLRDNIRLGEISADASD